MDHGAKRLGRNSRQLVVGQNFVSDVQQQQQRQTHKSLAECVAWSAKATDYTVYWTYTAKRLKRRGKGALWKSRKKPHFWLCSSQSRHGHGDWQHRGLEPVTHSVSHLRKNFTSQKFSDWKLCVFKNRSKSIGINHQLIIGERFFARLNAYTLYWIFSKGLIWLFSRFTISYF